MSGMLRVEARHLARSPLLWLAFALAAWTLANELWGYWPTLAGEALLVYRSGFLGAAGAVWAGAWLGLRDRVSGAADLVTVTPTPPWRLWRARLAGVAVVAAGAYAVVFAAILAVSAARGGRGMPDLRLLDSLARRQRPGAVSLDAAPDRRSPGAGPPPRRACAWAGCWCSPAGG
jgi:hypothetical protein